MTRLSGPSAEGVRAFRSPGFCCRVHPWGRKWKHRDENPRLGTPASQLAELFPNNRDTARPGSFGGMNVSTRRPCSKGAEPHSHVFRVRLEGDVNVSRSGGNTIASHAGARAEARGGSSAPPPPPPGPPVDPLGCVPRTRPDLSAPRAERCRRPVQITITLA